MRRNTYFIDVRETGFRLTAEALENTITENKMRRTAVSF